MKKLIIAAVAIAVLMAGGMAMAADTATVTVTATVQGTCLFLGAKTATLAFPPLTAGGPDETASATLQFWCSNGTVFTLTDDSGLNELGPGAPRMASTTLGATEYLPYTFTATPSALVGGGLAAPVTLTVDGSVTSANYSARTADVYRDTITFTVNP